MAIVEVVKYNGGADTLAWKYPNDELGTWTQLIVNESQEAALYQDGQIFDIFPSGRYTLDTPNIPLLNKVVNLPFGGRSPFAAEVWFINRAYQLDVKWGTPSPIQIQDPKYGIFAPVRSNGIFGIRVEDSEKFLFKLVGTLPVFDKAALVKYFRGLYVTKVKDSISSYLIHEQISIMEINAYLDEISAYMKERIEPVMAEYGISLVSFYVNDISVPEDDPAISKLKEALAKRAEMNIIGYSYQQERSFDTLESAAKNAGASSAPFMGAGIGMGMGMGVSASVAHGFSGVAKELKLQDAGESGTCPQCHAAVPKAQRFCGHCGYHMESAPGKKSGEGVLCPKCEKPLPADVKFCPECGAAVAKCCPKCGGALEGTPKFCPECGERLSVAVE